MAKRVVFPTYGRAAGPGPLLSRYILDCHEKSLVKVNDIWIEIITPSQDLLREVGDGNWFIGGYTYILTDAEATASGLPAQYLQDA